MLTQTFRDLERDGLIARTVFPTKPPSVEYRLTPLGKTILEPLTVLVQWAGRGPQTGVEEERAVYRIKQGIDPWIWCRLARGRYPQELASNGGTDQLSG